MIGNGVEAESFLLWGKSISCSQNLPLFEATFSSILGMKVISPSYFVSC